MTDLERLLARVDDLEREIAQLDQSTLAWRKHILHERDMATATARVNKRAAEVEHERARRLRTAAAAYLGAQNEGTPAEAREARRTLAEEIER